MPVPVMLDGDLPLDEDTHRRLGIILFVAILFAIPPEFPVEPIERWDADATYSLDVDEFADLSDDWSASLVAELTNPSMQDRAYTMTATILGTSLWNMDTSCEKTICEGILQPGESKSIEIIVTHENTTHQPTFVEFHLEIDYDDAHTHVETGTIYPLLDASVGAEWYHVRNKETVLSCLDVYVQEGSTAEISFLDVGDEWLPYLWLDGQAGLTQSLTSEDTIVCLEGVDQALPVNAQSMIRMYNWAIQHLLLDLIQHGLMSSQLLNKVGSSIKRIHGVFPLQMEGLCTKRTLLPALETNSRKRRVVQTPQIGHGT